MSRYDCSHDYAHVQRVLRLARYIAEQEHEEEKRQESGIAGGRGEREAEGNMPVSKYNHDIITLAALLHDVGDKKYVGSRHESGSSFHLAYDLLIANGASVMLASTVLSIVENVSYSSEAKMIEEDPQHGAMILARYPDLGPVQDADRLDALGAVGIARCFAYRGALSERCKRSAKRKGEDVRKEEVEEEKEKEVLVSTIHHFDEKLLKLEGEVANLAA